MKIETKYNIGDKITYDGCKKGFISGYEISDTMGIMYKISAEKESNDNYYADCVFLINSGRLRSEESLM